MLRTHTSCTNSIPVKAHFRSSVCKCLRGDSALKNNRKANQIVTAAAFSLLLCLLSEKMWLLYGKFICEFQSRILNNQPKNLDPNTQIDIAVQLNWEPLSESRYIYQQYNVNSMHNDWKMFWNIVLRVHNRLLIVRGEPLSRLCICGKLFYFAKCTISERFQLLWSNGLCFTS